MKTLFIMLTAMTAAHGFTATETTIADGTLTIKTPDAVPAEKAPAFEVADKRYGRFIPAQASWQDGSVTLTYESHAPLKEQQENIVWRCSDGTKSYGGDITFRAVQPGQYPAVGRIKVACVGDSITFGMGIRMAENKYPEQLQRMLGDAFQVGRFGNSAKTASRVKPGVWYGLQKEHRDALDFRADLYVSNLGINDVNRGTWNPENVQADYAELIHAWRGPQGATVMMWTRLAPDFRSHEREAGFPGNVNPAYDFRLSEMETSTHRPAMEAICARLAKQFQCPTLDMYTPLKDHPELTVGDGLHPNRDGAKIIATETAKAIRNLWPEQPAK